MDTAAGSPRAGIPGRHPFYQGKPMVMENGNGEQEMSPESHPTLLLTTAGLEEWAMENGEGSPPAAHPARDARAMST